MLELSKLTFKSLAEKILKEEEKPLSSEDIWEIAIQKEYNKQGSFTGKTPWRSIAAQIYVDIRDNPESHFVKMDSKPRKFFLKNLVDDVELIKLEEDEKGKIDELKEDKYKEKDLHPFLTYYSNLDDIYSKTIHHEKSKKTQKYMQWRHPDIVGILFDEMNSEVFNFSKEIGYNSIKLYSFELKKSLDFSNLRESYFQAVSNSSWANEGYLVAAKIIKDTEFEEELQRLSSSFGIGIIKLDIKNPDSSETMFPARVKQDLDWNTINKLANENPDFKNFIIRIKNDYSSKEIRKEAYDHVYEADELIRKLNK